MPHTLGNQRLNSHKINIHTLIQPAIELHSHHFYELVYVLAGSAMQTLGDTTVQVNKGDYFIIDYGSYHSYADCKNFQIINCLFMPEFIDKTLAGCTSFAQLITNYLIRFNYTILSKVPTNNVFTDTDGHIQALFETLLTEYTDRKHGFIELIRCSLVEILVRSLRSIVDPDKPQRHSAALKLTRYIDEHFGENISLSRLGRELGFSLPYLSRLFHREVGTSFQQYLQKTRIEHSCRLLAETRLTIMQIAQEVGYNDTKHFGKLFRETVHMSPREFRKSVTDVNARRNS